MPDESDGGVDPLVDTRPAVLLRSESRPVNLSEVTPDVTIGVPVAERTLWLDRGHANRYCQPERIRAVGPIA